MKQRKTIKLFEKDISNERCILEVNYEDYNLILDKIKNIMVQTQKQKNGFVLEIRFGEPSTLSKLINELKIVNQLFGNDD